MRRKETIHSVVVVVIAIAVTVVSSIPASAAAEEVRPEAVELLVVPIDDEAVIEFVPTPRAVVSWDPAEIEIESVLTPHRHVREAAVHVARFDPDPSVPPTAPCAVVIVPSFPERVRQYPARISIHPVRIVQR